MFANLQRIVNSTRAVRAWFLDSPGAGKPALITELGLHVQGWLLTREAVSSSFMVVRTSRGTQALAFTERRPDVIQSVLGGAPPDHPQMVCGFSGFVPLPVDEFTLGVSLEGEVTWLSEVRLGASLEAELVPPRFKVLCGRDGWLFLDNDSNRSVDQHMGRLILDDGQLARWRSYLDQCRALAAESGARQALLIAASKEQVLPEYYPYPRGARTVSDQVLALCGPADHVVPAALVLAAQPDREACFIKTDTHWSDRGALRVVLALLEELGLDAGPARRHFAADTYCIRPHAGDLGGKLIPARVSATEFLLAPPVDAVFDGVLPGAGRKFEYAQREALWPLRLLWFGSSSTHTALKYLGRLFQRVVFVENAGAVDPALVRQERPDVLVMQTTARYLIEPPAMGAGQPRSQATPARGRRFRDPVRG